MLPGNGYRITQGMTIDEYWAMVQWWFTGKTEKNRENETAPLPLRPLWINSSGFEAGTPQWEVFLTAWDMFILYTHTQNCGHTLYLLHKSCFIYALILFKNTKWFTYLISIFLQTNISLLWDSVITTITAATFILHSCLFDRFSPKIILLTFYYQLILSCSTRPFFTIKSNNT
jgi:hypothetical protein